MLSLSLVVWGALAQAGDATAPDAGTLSIHGAAELSVALLPSGPTGGGLDFFATLRPVFGLRAADDFEAEVGPSFRFRLIDTDPVQRGNDFGGVLRREDWDETSDFGQLISVLRIAPDTSPFFIRAGPVWKKTLGLGHIVNRYSNQENENYHPAAASAVIALGPVRGTVFASDMFGARLFAADLGWDLGRTLSKDAATFDRYVVALELAHDFASAGQPAGALVDLRPLQQLTILQLDGSAVLVRNASTRFMFLAGFGSRANQAANVGLVVGLALDATVAEVGLSFKFEGRKVAGGFRHGIVGPTYELGRFAGLGLSGIPIAQENLPDAFSLYGEARVGIGPDVSFDVMAEYFTFGRTDLDGTLNLTLVESWVVGQARFTVVGLGAQPRYSGSLGVRVRLFPSFYLLGSGGTAFFPQPDGTLNRGVTASVGAGVDFSR